MTRTTIALVGRLCGVLAVCTALSGCAAYRPIPTSRFAFELERRSEQSLDNVHVIFVESPADVGRWGRIEEVCCEMRDMGLRNAVYFEPLIDGSWCELANDVRDIRAENPNSRIMLVGWSMGSMFVKNALTELEADGESVDTIVYLDSMTIKLSDITGHPENYDRAVLIYRRGHPMPCLPNSVSLCVDECHHLPVGHHERTIDQLVQEAIRLADSLNVDQ